VKLDIREVLTNIRDPQYKNCGNLKTEPPLVPGDNYEFLIYFK
jgi:hypothetical protein